MCSEGHASPPPPPTIATLNVYCFNKKITLPTLFWPLSIHILLYDRVIIVWILPLSRVYIWMKTTHVEAKRSRTYGTFVHCSAFAEAANRPYINVLNANSLSSTDSRRIVFDCLPNVCHTAKCCLPRFGNMATLNDRFVFAYHIRVCIQM